MHRTLLISVSTKQMSTSYSMLKYMKARQLKEPTNLIK